MASSSASDRRRNPRPKVSNKTSSKSTMAIDLSTLGGGPLGVLSVRSISAGRLSGSVKACPPPGAAAGLGTAVAVGLSVATSGLAVEGRGPAGGVCVADDEESAGLGGQVDGDLIGGSGDRVDGSGRSGGDFQWVVDDGDVVEGNRLPTEPNKVQCAPLVMGGFDVFGEGDERLGIG